MNNKNLPSAIVHGNYEDKYKTKNLISKILVSNFLRTFEKNLGLLGDEPISTICEIGCAEGELLKTVRPIYPDAALYASDISEDEIIKAKQNCKSIQVIYSVQNAEHLEDYKDSLFDLVICCEVLEHLPNPLQGLRELLRISKKYILVSVPNEPIWRILNMARGKYIRSFGDTPGHLNHWNVIQLPQFLLANPDISIIKKTYPLPWQMILLEKRKS